MSIYKLQGNGTGGTEESVGSLDIQFDGEINAIHGAMDADLDADLEVCAAEVSFLSSNTIGINDARGSLFQLRVRTNETGVGKSDGHANSAVSGIKVPVTAGERVHLHLVASAGVVSSNQFYLYVDDGAATGLRRRR